MESEIIGVLPSRNMYSVGLPFVESIYSTMQVVDKLYIIDDSTDKTKDILKEMSANPRIEVITKPWTYTAKNTKMNQIVADITNVLLEIVKRKHLNKGKNSHILSMQAAEVIHEKEYENMKAIPERYKDYRGFFLDYLLMYGDVVLSDQFRMRMMPLTEKSRIIGDACMIYNYKPLDVKYNAEIIGKQLYYMFKYGSSFENIWQLFGDFRYINSRQPIYRYCRIFPRNMAERIEEHRKMAQKSYFDEGYQKIIKKYENSPLFYEKVAEYEYDELPKYIPQREYYDKLPKVPKEGHPKIMQDILYDKKYEIRKRLVEAIIYDK